MIVVSLVLNIGVLIAVAGSLVAGAPWTRTAYGERTPARDILLAVYLAILIGSGVLLAATLLGPSSPTIGAVIALLGVQIVYKAITAATVRHALRNPVVVSNLVIAAVHAVTVATLLPVAG